MKTQKEIEQLAEKLWREENERLQDVGGIPSAYNFIKAFTVGYTQCQEDIFNELNEWIVITLSAESKLGASDNVIEALLNVKYKIESLNKQD